jgi:hypothetical protein
VPTTSRSWAVEARASDEDAECLAAVVVDRKLFEGLDACMDMQAFLLEGLSAEGMSAELAGCVMNRVDAASLERMVVVSFTQGDDALDADPALVTAFEQAGAQCAAAGVT